VSEREDPAQPLLLASASPRRRELLRRLGWAIELHPVTIDENVLENEEGAAAVLRLAQQKALRALSERPGRVILAADTLVVCQGQVLGKPVDAASAHKMLRTLSGRWHEVITGLALLDARGKLHADLSRTKLRFAKLPEEEILSYLRGTEPYDKAGAYAIQGAAGWFIEEIRGSASNVVGLPYETLRRLIALAGIKGPSLQPRDVEG